MALGPGKYDNVCTEVREKTKAEGVVLLVIKGELGSGFSVQADLVTTAFLPETLRSMAQQIEDSYGRA